MSQIEIPRELGRMDGRVAVVTGASSGIGAAIARELALKGGRVYAAARRAELIPGAVGEELVASGNVIPTKLDVSKEEEVEALFTRLAAEDPVDTIVLAAGVNVPKRRIGQLSSEDWRTLVDINLSGVFYCVRHSLDQLRERMGDVVIISSIAASWPDHSGPGYGATKSGLLGLARGMSRDEHMNGVRVSSILPGIVDTAILDKRPIPPTQELRDLMVKPEDVAAATLMAVSMPARTNLAEISIVATRLQSLSKTQDANPPMPQDAVAG